MSTVFIAIVVLSKYRFRCTSPSVIYSSDFYKRASEEGKVQDNVQPRTSSSSSISKNVVPLISEDNKSANEKKKDYVQLLRTRNKTFKYTQAGLKIAKSALDPESYAELELKAKMFRTHVKKYRKEERDGRKERFATGIQSEQDEISKLNAHNRWKKYRAKERNKKTKEERKKGIQDANSTALAQLFPSKPFLNQIRKPAKDSSEK